MELYKWFIWNHKKNPNCQNNSERERKKNKTSRRYNSPRLQTILESYSTQDSAVLVPKQTYRPMEQNREPRNKPRHQRSINLQQRKREYKMGKSLFSKRCWENWTAACESMKLKHNLTSCTMINSTQLKDLNIRQDTIKLLEEDTGNVFSDINHTNVFLGQSLKAIEIKAKINQWDLIKHTSFCTAKETMKKKTYRMG